MRCLFCEKKIKGTGLMMPETNLRVKLRDQSARFCSAGCISKAIQAAEMAHHMSREDVCGIGVYGPDGERSGTTGLVVWNAEEHNFVFQMLKRYGEDISPDNVIGLSANIHNEQTVASGVIQQDETVPGGAVFKLV